MNISFAPLILASLFMANGCKNQASQSENDQGTVKTPVTIGVVEMTSISENIILNATSSYLKKNEVKATTGGYIENLAVSLGQYVKAGAPLFTLKTKEAEVLGKLDEKDPLYGIKGQITIAAPVSGIVTAILAQIHSYVNDGDAVVVVADTKSFVFILHVPFEQIEYAKAGTKCRILLPNSTQINGVLSNRLSEVDAASQTQSIIITPQSNQVLPENLVVTVELEKSARGNAQVVDKACILSDETMENFWVMELINDSTAIKVPVTMGLSTDDRIEILTPLFPPGIRLISSGSYGLPDTANVTIIK